MNIELITAILFFCLVVLLLSGLPLAFTLAGLGLGAAYFLWGPQTLLLIAVQTYDVMTEYFMVGIPLYIFMANMLQLSGIIEEMYAVMEKWFGPLRGGLAIGTVAICTVLAAMTGVVGAAVATMGILALPSMLSRGYDKKIAVGAICAGGTLGILIPPSVITIVYAVTAGVSIGKMLIGGVVPGLLLAALYMSYIGIRCHINPSLGPVAPPEQRAMITLRDKLIALKGVIFPIMLILSVLGTIYTGVATPNEAAGIGCLGAIISAFLHKRLSWGNLREAALTTARITAMIMWITIGARCFISVFSAVGGAEFIKQAITGLDVNRWIILIFMQLLLFFLGCFLDEIGIILMCVPIFLPIVKTLDFDIIWFGILFLVNAQMAYISPPFGYTLFYLKGVAPPEIGIGDIWQAIIPFLLLQAFGLSICMIWPQIVLWLPNTMQ